MENPIRCEFQTSRDTMDVEGGAGSLLLWIPATLALLYFLHHSTSRKHRGRLPPGPTPLPIIGNLLQLGNKPHRSLARLAKSYGPLMSLKLGQVTTIVVSNPETAREVLRKNDRSFAGRHLLDVMRVLDHHKASLIWLPAGAKWRNLRRICGTQMFQSQKLNDNQALRQNKVRDLVAYVKERGFAGEKVDIGRAAFTVVLNSISNTFFSIDLADIRLESAQDFKELVWAIMEEAGKPNVSDFFPVLTAADLQGRRRRMEGFMKKLDAIFYAIIERRMHAKEEGEAETAATTNDFLDSLLEYHNKDDDSRLDQHGIRAVLRLLQNLTDVSDVVSRNDCKAAELGTTLRLCQDSLKETTEALLKSREQHRLLAAELEAARLEAEEKVRELEVIVAGLRQDVVQLDAENSIRRLTRFCRSTVGCLHRLPELVFSLARSFGYRLRRASTDRSVAYHLKDTSDKVLKHICGPSSGNHALIVDWELGKRQLLDELSDRGLNFLGDAVIQDDVTVSAVADMEWLKESVADQCMEFGYLRGLEVQTEKINFAGSVARSRAILLKSIIEDKPETFNLRETVLRSLEDILGPES